MGGEDVVVGLKGGPGAAEVIPVSNRGDPQIGKLAGETHDLSITSKVFPVTTAVCLW